MQTNPLLFECVNTCFNCGKSVRNQEEGFSCEKQSRIPCPILPLASHGKSLLFHKQQQEDPRGLPSNV